VNNVSDISAELRHAASIIEDAQTFLLTCHIHPDGDALGSTMAMAHALKSAGKEVTATFPEPFIVPHSLQKSLPGIDILTQSDQLAPRYDVMMTFDCGSRSRLGELDQKFGDVEHVINVDHHISNEGFGTTNVIDVDAASSGSVVQALLEECSIALTRDVAQCVYVALLTDTGRFQFSSTTPDVFEQARILSEFELPIAELSRTLTEEDPYAFLKLAGEALSEMEFDTDAQLVSAVASIDLQHKHGVTYEETEGLIEFVRRAREADVACVVKEFSPGDYRVSLRSLGTIDVCMIAEKRGGGGHRYAAGFSSTHDPREIIDGVLSDVRQQRSELA
jgi:phosphoesterase RecJ-like protein